MINGWMERILCVYAHKCMHERDPKIISEFWGSDMGTWYCLNRIFNIVRVNKQNRSCLRELAANLRYICLTLSNLRQTDLQPNGLSCYAWLIVIVCKQFGFPTLDPLHSPLTKRNNFFPLLHTLGQLRSWGGVRWGENAVGQLSQRNGWIIKRRCLPH